MGDDEWAIEYWLLENGDIERWVMWEDRKDAIREKYPELVAALENVKTAQKALERIAKNIVEEHHACEV